ncbi:thioredoxin family protein [Marinifilum sp.]|uniref:thioredoxin family protein n=1 Tax=Marinifilum sp. TaxID=2033137 RepID=UPI003BA9EF66
MIFRKNKKLFLAALLTLFGSSAMSQGIEFKNGYWEEIKEIAKNENKLIFIDFYTDWCGPCKKMNKEVFPLDTVGKFYNKHFICYKVDAEKGEGPKLAKLYGVASFPTYIYSDFTSKLLHRKSAYMKAEQFIKLGQIALDPGKRFAPLEEEFNNGNRDKDFVLNYFKLLRAAGGSVDPKLAEYLESLPKKEITTLETYDLINKYGSNIRGDVYKILIDNFDTYCRIAGEEAVVEKIHRRFLLSHSHHFGSRWAEKYADHSVKDFVQTLNYPYKERLLAEIDINFLTNCQKNEELSRALLQYFENQCKSNPKLILKMMEKKERFVKSTKLYQKLLEHRDKAKAKMNP